MYYNTENSESFTISEIQLFQLGTPFQNSLELYLSTSTSKPSEHPLPHFNFLETSFFILPLRYTALKRSTSC